MQENLILKVDLNNQKQILIGKVISLTEKLKLQIQRRNLDITKNVLNNLHCRKIVHYCSVCVPFFFYYSSFGYNN